jgi:small subunit ribosomal protein S16
MLTIRLSRIGKKKKPMYRLIISEKARDPYGRALEIFGSYNPFSKEIQVNSERINYWLSKGAGMSPTVNNLLIDKEIIKGKKVTASKGDKVKEEAKKEAAKTAESKEKPEDTVKDETPKPETT